MTREWERLRELIARSSRVVFFGGAGVSTQSGIPDFRSAHGLYSGAEGRSYEEMLSINYFMDHTDDFWKFYKDVMLYPDAKPNAAHYALARLERQGKLKAVVTQNIDGLHQAAGSKRVLELHGTVHNNSCVECRKRYTLGDVLCQKGTPHCCGTELCICEGVIRPDIVMYGEQLDEKVLSAAISAIMDADLLIVGGTSLVVNPAAGLIGYRNRAATLALINRDATPYDGMAQLVLRDNIAEVLDAVIPQE